MKHELLAELGQRNAKIIAAIIKKAHRVCPGSIALIGISGYFAPVTFMNGGPGPMHCDQ